ncbi:MAG: phosphatidylserine decarboxylase [Chlamydiales bacterium]|jgi:phosphatidylserine decarboxylase
MNKILYFDRLTKQMEEESVYGKHALEFLYGESWISRIFGRALLPFLVRYPFFSRFYGACQSSPLSVRKIKPFIEHFGVDVSEFLEPLESFRSFNDFFYRKLKKEARPIAKGDDVAIIPTDGRYLFYQDISEADGFIVKGKKFCLKTLLGDEDLAKIYEGGSMVIARLCPTDYHRFHFPFSGTPGESCLINGWLSSVNPMALKKNVDILTQNRRFICPIASMNFGKVLFLEIGATNVGSVYQTYSAKNFYEKGSEKGYFAFGASALIILFEPGKIVFDSELLSHSQNHIEVKCLLGQSMGRVNKS